MVVALAMRGVIGCCRLTVMKVDQYEGDGGE